MFERNIMKKFLITVSAIIALADLSNVAFAQDNPNKHSETTIALVTMIEELNEKLASDDDYGDLSSYIASTLICGEGKMSLQKAQQIMRRKQIDVLQNLGKKSNLAFKKLTMGNERAMTITVSAVFTASEYQTKGMIISLFMNKDEAEIAFLCSSFETNALAAILNYR